MLAICRYNAQSLRANSSSLGFSLVEIVVVLLLLGLVSGIAVPRLITLFNSLQTKNTLAEIHQVLQSAPQDAYIEGRQIDLSTHLIESGVVPDSWQFMFPEPIRVKANGVCLGGQMLLHAGGQTYRYQITAPLCRVEEA